ncbi:MAG: SIMPL domain-containing protein [Bacteroidota bacterium]
MRKLILLTVLCPVFMLAKSQQPSANPFPKTISVSGSAEMEIIPDEIYVNVVLREYQKRGETKKELELIKTDFLNACKAVSLPDSIISIVSYTGYNSYYWLRKKKKNPDMNASITYQVKFSSSKQMDDLVEKLDDEATQSFNIVNTGHSKMTEFRKQLKIQAVKAAKDKAIYLTDAIGEKLGSAITVKEPEEPGIDSYNTNIRLRGVNTLSSQAISYYKPEVDKGFEVDFKKIKLRFEVNVIFALQ